MRLSCNRLTSTLTSCTLRSPKRTQIRSASTTTMSPSVAEAAGPALQVVQGLKPAPLWNFFAELSAIPRPSKKEEKVVEWLRDFAAQRNLEFKQDKIGNVVITRPGSGGGENAPYVLLQGHIDMVCEKNTETVHDFEKDPLKLKIDGEWLKAEGTTLGSDNGIGVCAALALLDSPPTMKLPPLEALFTIDEETGLTGAFELDGSMIRSKMMLNLDTEVIDEIIIGCAGGGDSRFIMPAAPIPAPTEGHAAYVVQVRGFQGGHSGVNIHECRGNACISLARVLANAGKALGALPLVATITGGDKRNAIPREAEATVLVPSDQAAAFEASVAATAADLRGEYGVFEPGMAITASRAADAAASTVLDPTHAEKLLALLRTLPHGVHKISHVIPNLVETSNNVASIRLNASEGTATVVTSTRSSIMSALEDHRDTLCLIATSLGCLRIERESAYPGWAPNSATEILAITKASYKRVMGKDAHVTAIHAGLECGLLTDKVPGMEAVSFGPTITGAHSPDERVLIRTVEQFWNLTLDIVSTLSDRKM